MPSPTAPHAASVLALVRAALDQFDTVHLSVSARQAIRIANLVGDTQHALELGFNLRPLNHEEGARPASRDMVERLIGEQFEDTLTRRAVFEAAFAVWSAERALPDGRIDSHSLRELELWSEELPGADDVTGDAYKENLEFKLRQIRIIERLRHNVFTLLCRWERQLAFAARQERTLESMHSRVDQRLAATAPEVVDQFNVAFRRLEDTASRDKEAEASEEYSQALASCRRILKAVVDLVRPVDPSRTVTAEGHVLDDEHYKNRLVEFLQHHAASSNFRTALSAGGEHLFGMFSAIDSQASKGVHARVALEEAEFCAVSTYALAAELFAIAGERAKEAGEA